MRLVVTQRACHNARCQLTLLSSLQLRSMVVRGQQQKNKNARVTMRILRTFEAASKDKAIGIRQIKVRVAEDASAVHRCAARPQRLLSLWQDLFFKHPRVLRCFSQLLGVGRSESNTMEKANEIGRLLLGDPSLSMSKKPSFRMRVELDNDALVRGATTAAAATSPGDVNVAEPAGWPETTPQV